LADISLEDIKNLKGNFETKRLEFFYPDEVPGNIIDFDLIQAYLDYINKTRT